MSNAAASPPPSARAPCRCAVLVSDCLARLRCPAPMRKRRRRPMRSLLNPRCSPAITPWSCHREASKSLMHNPALAKFSLYQLACNSTACSVSDSSQPEMLQLCCSSWNIQPLSLLPMLDCPFDYFGTAFTLVLFRHCSSKEYTCSSALCRNRTSS